MSIFTEVMVDVSQSVNETLGEACALYVKDPYNEQADLLLPSINVIVDKSKEVKGKLNNIVSYLTAVKILSSDLATQPKGDSWLQTSKGEVYSLHTVIEQNDTVFWLVAKLTSDEFPV